jgi:fructoselysine-6-P-deglycase FrlB-like protein
MDGIVMPDASRSTTSMEGEVRRQPASWARAVDQLPDVAAALPRRGERVAVIGCGTSWFMAMAYASLREQHGDGETDAFSANEFRATRSYDRVVAISRSGTTTEVLRALEPVRAPVLAISAVPATPIVDIATDAIVLDFADEQAVVQTVFPTTVLMMLRASLGADLEAVVAQANAQLSAATVASTATQFTYLGQGWAYAIALEAALKMRETAQLWTESYQQMEYRHGPIAIAEPGRTVWVFGDIVPGLATDLAATGVTVINDDLDPLVDLIRVQRLALEQATRLGLDPDRPRNLTRSVVLDQAAPQP